MPFSFHTAAPEKEWTFPYILHYPDDYVENSDCKYPVIVVLHGKNQRKVISPLYVMNIVSS